MFTPQNWFCLKISFRNEKWGLCTFSARCDLYEGSTFLAGGSGSEFLERHLFNSLNNEVGYWFVTTLWLSLAPQTLPWYLYACLLIGRDWDPILLFAFGNGKNFFQLAKLMYMLSSSLLGRQRKRASEGTFIEVSIVTVHLWFIWDFHIAFNLYNIFVFCYSGRALENSHG